jgi:biopolymer transport protein ExbB
MLGFLGTVTGMVSAFQTIEAHGGMANPASLAGGIWEALVTTVFGLAVGIPAYALYNYFVTRVARFVHEMEVTTTEFLDLVEQHVPADAPLPVEREPREPRQVQQKHDRTLVFEDDEYFRKKA